jgi:chromosome segregation ATPase
VAAEQVTEPTETDSIKEDSTMTDEQLKKLEDQLAEATAKLAEATEKIVDLEGQLKEKEDGFASIEEELTGLREFKAQIEKTDAEAEKLASVRAKFAEAEIEKPDEYFIENKDRFLSLEEEEVEFMVQEMSAFAKLAQASADTDGDDGEEQDEGLPAIVNTDGNLDLSDPKKLGQMLRLREAEKAKK